MISVVIPAYNEASNLRALWEKLRAAFDGLPEEKFECVIVDDGSTDGTAALLEEIRKEDPRLRWLRLLKNGGSHEAIGLGLKACRGQAAIVLAADLQDPPELFREIIFRWRAGAAVVWAVREARPGETPVNKAASKAYYRVMNLLLASKFPSTGADFFLADRRVIDALAGRYRRHSPNVLFQVASLGFESARVGYVKAERHSGKSKWGFKKRVLLFTDSVLAFSPPLFQGLGAILLAWASSFFLGTRAYGPAVIFSALFIFYIWRLLSLFRVEPIAVMKGDHE